MQESALGPRQLATVDEGDPSVSLLIGACDPMRRPIRVCRPALGTLTWLGAATHQANGLWLRDRYVAEHGLLPSTLAAGDVVARSTPFPRCVQSCQNLLLGLYPPEHRGGPGDDNHTTPVGSTSRQHEPMYGVWYTNSDDCPRMLQLLHHMYATQSAAINADDAALEARVKAEIGVCINGNAGLGDAIRCQQQYRLPLINGWSDEFATTVREYTHRTFMLKCVHVEPTADMAPHPRRLPPLRCLHPV